MIYSDLQMLLLFVIGTILIIVTPLGYQQFLSMYSHLREANLELLIYVTALGNA